MSYKTSSLILQGAEYVFVAGVNMWNGKVAHVMNPGLSVVIPCGQYRIYRAADQFGRVQTAGVFGLCISNSTV